MTIEEAIKQFREDAENNRADLDMEFAKENEQVAEWLEELQTLKYCREKWDERQYEKGKLDAWKDIKNIINGMTNPIQTMEIIIKNMKGLEE